MAYDMIDYGRLVDEAMHIIVYKVLKIIQGKGLPGNHHFFISFITKYPGVKLSKSLLNRYPREMTVVLQYQFQDLFVDQNGFTVTLSFNGIKEKIYISFGAITTFADPSVQFGLQFREADYEYHDEINVEIEDGPKNQKSKRTENKDEINVNNVVSLDQFRKK